MKLILDSEGIPEISTVGVLSGAPLLSSFVHRKTVTTGGTDYVDFEFASYNALKACKAADIRTGTTRYKIASVSVMQNDTHYFYLFVLQDGNRLSDGAIYPTTDNEFCSIVFNQGLNNLNYLQATVRALTLSNNDLQYFYGYWNGGISTARFQVLLEYVRQQLAAVKTARPTVNLKTLNFTFTCKMTPTGNNSLFIFYFCQDINKLNTLGVY